MKEEKERKQFNVQDFVSNEETPVETRDGRGVVIEINNDCSCLVPVKGQIEGKRYELGKWESWNKDGKGFMVADDLFFKNTKLELTPLNLVELLRNVPKGTKLYSPLFDKEVLLDEVDGDKIRVITKAGNKYRYEFYERGNFIRDEGECLLFPSKENRDWQTFKIESKSKAFQVGDYVKKKDSNNIFRIKKLDNSSVTFIKILSNLSEIEERTIGVTEGIMESEYLPNNYEKVEKFNHEWLKSFDKVIVRNSAKQIWIIGWFSHSHNKCYVTDSSYTFSYCIPFNEETEHLVGTDSEEPDEFYKS